MSPLGIFCVILAAPLQSQTMQGSQSVWSTADTYTFTNTPGPLTIAIDGHNTGGPAGILFSAVINDVAYHSGTDWHCIDPADEEMVPHNWNQPGFNFSSWPTALLYGNNGAAPWGNIAGFYP